jgi:hypothetical protein
MPHALRRGVRREAAASPTLMLAAFVLVLVGPGLSDSSTPPPRSATAATTAANASHRVRNAPAQHHPPRAVTAASRESGRHHDDVTTLPPQRPNPPAGEGEQVFLGKNNEVSATVATPATAAAGLTRTYRHENNHRFNSYGGFYYSYGYDTTSHEIVRACCQGGPLYRIGADDPDPSSPSEQEQPEDWATSRHGDGGGRFKFGYAIGYSYYQGGSYGGYYGGYDSYYGGGMCTPRFRYVINCCCKGYSYYRMSSPAADLDGSANRQGFDEVSRHKNGRGYGGYNYCSSNLRDQCCGKGPTSLPSPPPPNPPPPIPPAVVILTCSFEGLDLPNVEGPGNCNEDQTLAVGATCTPECANGTTPSGPSTCTAGTGGGDPVLNPTRCIDDSIIRCEVTAPTNGALGSCTQTILSGATCEFECSIGYLLEGSTTCDAGTLTSGVCTQGKACTIDALPQLTLPGDCPVSPATLPSGFACQTVCSTTSPAGAVPGQIGCNDGITTYPEPDPCLPARERESVIRIRKSRDRDKKQGVSG